MSFLDDIRLRRLEQRQAMIERHLTEPQTHSNGRLLIAQCDFCGGPIVHYGQCYNNCQLRLGVAVRKFVKT
jgi:hypothetical protein